ncbi:MAG: hypothetical protein U9Q97_09305, partial [Acidobacteriota bacterium]|nr:hypothetical protein [Acidobacteriota bacterium]
LRYVDEDVVIIVLANTNTYRAWKVSKGLARVVFGYDYTLPKKSEKMELESGINEHWGLPDSITGKRSASLLSAIDSQDPKEAEKFIKNNLASSFLKDFSLEEHLCQFKKMQKEIGKIELLGAMKTGEYSVRLKVKSKASGKFFQISFEIQSEPPHKITSIGVDVLD